MLAKLLATKMDMLYQRDPLLVSISSIEVHTIDHVQLIGMGGKPLVYNQLTEADLDELARAKPTLTYGSGVKQAPVDFVPAHVAFDKKVCVHITLHVCTHHLPTQVLCFTAYFKQTVHESPSEYYRVRAVKIYYYLEDDSISVTEPPIENR